MVPVVDGRDAEVGLQLLFRGDGQHVAGLWPPVAVGNVLTESHTGYMAERPAGQLVHWPAICPNPHSAVGLVWYTPLVDDPLSYCPAVLPHLVQVLDNGLSVQLRAGTYEAIDATVSRLRFLIGGGHA